MDNKALIYASLDISTHLRVPTSRFANSRGCIKNKNISLGPFNGQKHQTRSTNQTGLRTLPTDIQGVERGKTRRSLHHNPCTKKETLEKGKIFFFWGGGVEAIHFSWIFVYCRGFGT